MRSPTKTKFANTKTKSRKKKVDKKLEAIVNCDHCRDPLGRMCVRNANSAICAEGVGIATKVINGKQMFFCSLSCRDLFESGAIT
jgi:YHS domain-containing protein